MCEEQVFIKLHHQGIKEETQREEKAFKLSSLDILCVSSRGAAESARRAALMSVNIVIRERKAKVSPCLLP